MTYRTLLASGILCIAIMPLLAQNPGTPASGQGKPSTTKQSTTEHAVQAGEGQRVFNQNCSRCHDAPQSFPPAISGTIVRHMRVRAGLSREDEKALLRFLNP
jgi:cytochrome c5